jgi:energy-coupling factor transporter ATP-binding protein EcfA2
MGGPADANTTSLRGTIASVVLELGTDDLKTGLSDLATSLRALAIPVSDPVLAGKRDWVVRTIDGYLIPRIDNPGAPLTVVFAGPTGAGKSTLLNSVAGADHTVAGPLRPTTKAPLVLASAPLAARYTTISGIRCQVVKGRAPILSELTLIDTPDIDSMASIHRAIAETMIDNADVVVYVNSALRYSDLVPWEVLRRAASRGVPIIHVLNRLKSSSSGSLAAYTARLRGEGLGAEVVGVHEHMMRRGGQSVPPAMIKDLRDRLVDVVESRRAGSADIAKSVLDAVVAQAREVLEGVGEMRTGNAGIASRTSDVLSVDLARITSSISQANGLVLDFGAVAQLSGKHFAPAWRVRRRVPSPERVRKGHRVVDAALVTAVDFDVATRLARAGAAEPGLETVSNETHDGIVNAVAVWHEDLTKMPVVKESVDPAHAASLLAWCAVKPEDAEAIDALKVLTGASDPDGALRRARDQLELHLLPVYTGVEYRVMARLGTGVASDVEVYRARTTLSAVIARSAFANA